MGREHDVVFPLAHMVKGITVKPPPAPTRQPPPQGPLPYVQLVRAECLGGEGDCSGDGGGCGECSSGGGGARRVRLHMCMFSAAPHWGLLNVTGALVDWSFTRDLADARAASTVGARCGSGARCALPAEARLHGWRLRLRVQRGHGGPCLARALLPRCLQGAAAKATHIVRLTSQHPDPHWPFWITIEDAAGNSSRGSGGKWGVRVELSVVDLTRTPVLEAVLRQLPACVTESWLSTVYQSFWDF